MSPEINRLFEEIVTYFHFTNKSPKKGIHQSIEDLCNLVEYIGKM